MSAAGSTSFSVDAEPGGAIDSTRMVAANEFFSVDVMLDSLADEATPWGTYQVALDFDNSKLSAPGTSFPGDWADAPVLNGSGGNLAPMVSGATCDPNPPYPDSLSSAGSTSTITLSCSQDDSGMVTTYSGALVQITFQCGSSYGVSTLHLRGGADTFVFSGAGTQNDETHDATIQCGTATLTNTPTPTNTPSTTSFSVDAIPGGAVDATRDVGFYETFSVNVNLDSVGPGASPYTTYQMEVDFDNTKLIAPQSGFPGDWANSPVLNTTGGNLATFTGGAACGPTPVWPVSLVVAGTKSTVQMFCFHNVSGNSTGYVGPLVQFVFQCGGTESTSTLHIRDVSYTFLLTEPNFDQYNDATQDATIHCDPAQPPGPTPTFTPTPTDTPLPPTHSPTPTHTPTPTNTPSSTSFSVDAVPGGAVDTTRDVGFYQTFSVNVNLDSAGPGASPYSTYQMEVDFDNTKLIAPQSGFPGNWANSPVLNTTGGNLATFASGALCDPRPAWPGSLLVSGSTSTIRMTCSDTVTGTSTGYVGPLVQFVFQCGGVESTSTLHIRGVDDTFLLTEPNFDQYNDATQDATIHCTPEYWAGTLNETTLGACVLSLAQASPTSMNVAGNATCNAATGGALSGTLNRATGALNAVLRFEQPEHVMTLAATLNQNGDQLSGTYTCACGDGALALSSHAGTTQSLISATLGGQMSTTHGDDITVPAGALTADTSLSASIQPAAQAAPVGMVALARTYVFGPTGTSFATPATAVFNYTTADLGGGIVDPTTLQLYEYNAGAQQWELVGGTVDVFAQTITASLAHFSQYAFFGQPVDADADGIADAYEAGDTCLNPILNDAAGDADNDGLSNLAEYQAGSSACSVDSDLDGCSDWEERGTEKTLGGVRNSMNQWDFYDINGSQKIDAADIAFVRGNFNPFGPLPPEDVIYDRGAGLGPWAPGPPDGRINALDIALVRYSFNSSCQAPP